MKMFPSLAFLVTSLAVVASEQGGLRGRELNTPFDVSITHAHGQTIKFNTGPGMGAGTKVKVKVTDKCKTESPTRVTEGFLFPDNNVPGIVADNTGVVNPGHGSVLSFRFAEGIDKNTDIYTAGMPGSATVSFCVEVGLYTGEEDMQVNFKEVKLTYSLNLMSNIGDLSSHVP